MYLITVPRRGSFEAWRASARALLCARVPPEEVEWTVEGRDPSLFAQPNRPLPAATATPKVTKAYLSLAKLVCSHSDPMRFARLYTMANRLQAGQSRLDDPSDAKVTELRQMEKSVRRDMHKMKAFVRFREIEPTGARRCFAAWFEPEHPIVEITAPFFARRFADMDWVIHTPEMAAIFRAGDLSFGLDPQRPPDIGDPTEDLWKTYYANIFNPARLKIKAMTSEMPRKYWRNLPEAVLIPDLISGAEKRLSAMRDAAPTLPPLRAARITQTLAAQTRTDTAPQNHTLDALRARAQDCQRCPLHCHATQVVFGEGPDNARLMIVGEQPGDHEDLAGRPFVGPAGQLFDQLAQRAGLDRKASYVTNAVKHFKFTPRGKRRLHQRPNVPEIQHCNWWLRQEINLVKPNLILALGATALRSLTGNGEAVARRRGTVETGLQDQKIFAARHPSSLLRAPTPDTRQALEREFVSDLQAVVDHLQNGFNFSDTTAR